MMENIRVRFAPSPTGYLHVGGARTALFNWLLARKYGGTFILRVEDTDRERSTPEAVRMILDGLRWLGLEWDEGPFFQTENLSAHREAAFRLVESGHAYRCYCTKEELDARREAAKAAGRGSWQYEGKCRDLSPSERAACEAAGKPFVVRFRVPNEGSITFDDLVYGTQTVQQENVEDFVLLRSDGQPTYHLGVVVDDVALGITHVIRGQDHLSNTPKQILLYQALGQPVPTFGHLPLILAPGGQKLSKRKHGAIVAVETYREAGFLPEAFVNFLALLGWSPGTEQELFSREELIAAFRLEQINRSNAIFQFNPDDAWNWTDPKALWLNAEYLRAMPLAELTPLVRERLQAADLWPAEAPPDREAWLTEAVALLRARYRTLSDFVTYGRPYFSDDFEYEAQAVQRNLHREPRLREWLLVLADRLAARPDFMHEALEATVRGYAEELGIKAGVLINAIRTAVTGQSVGPGLFELCLLLGQETVVRRLWKAVEMIEDRQC
jgi:glutamyl-tRNA synthetase